MDNLLPVAQPFLLDVCGTQELGTLSDVFPLSNVRHLEFRFASGIGSKISRVSVPPPAGVDVE